MTKQQVIDTIGWILCAVLLSILLYMCSASPRPLSVSDDKNMKDFKNALVSFSRGGQRFVFAKDIYGGTVFDAKKICLSIRDEYAEAGAEGQRAELRRLLPDSLLAIEKLTLREALPQAIIALQKADGGLVIATGRASLGTDRGDYLGLERVNVAGNGNFHRSTKARGARCADFEDAVFIASYSDINKRHYIILADRRSPSLWPYGGVMDDGIATPQIN
ncbi:MAG: hypothetical protein Q8K65_02360 [Alphaproteobacteria bacterium]|nr:hypothetical protein [Alphaproteobacteria bacterium]